MMYDHHTWWVDFPNNPIVFGAHMIINEVKCQNPQFAIIQ